MELPKTVLGPVLFKAFINYLDAGLESVSRNFADYTNLGGAVDCVEGREVWQKGLAKFQSWPVTKFMNFEQVLDSAPGKEQPWLYILIGELGC